MLIFEGADYAGKTTLSREVGKLLDWPVLKNEQEKYAFSQGNYRTVSEGFGYALMCMMMELDYRNRDFIKDRDYPTEIVYNRALGVVPNTRPLITMDYNHALMGTKIIYCERRNYDSVGYGDELINLSLINTIKKEYSNFLNSLTRCEHMTVYLEDGTPEENALKVVNWLKA